MKPEQCRAARGWFSWSQDDLAREASVSLSTVRDFEKGRRTPIVNNLEAMKKVFEVNGMTFKNEEDGKALGIEWTDSSKSVL